MELTVAKRNIEIKFDFKTMFKINNKLGTVNKETGERNTDGVGSLFYKILERDDSALVDLIKLSTGSGKKALSEDEILDAIAELVDEEGSTEALFSEIEHDMVESGFFKEKISKYIENMEKSVKYLEAKDDSDEAQIQVVKDMIGKMKDVIS
ncbi:tail assembly chaperone [Streptococcus halichoeri]|uniref:tail assembly chaperone n=1 Tax=Streptococcus halichoeri TaxID=254785 RepID=UPI001356D468|nr:tail assembly chaperone [Streptococcus halichoeri]